MMICCLNPECYNPPVPDITKFCPSCGVPLLILRNRYRPIKSLGGGGFGKTYLAEDVDTFNDKCVIKQFAPQTQGTGALQKATELFEQEAKQLQKLGKHPQIPALLAYFTENNRLYLLQEFIDGQNLFSELKQQGKFTEKKIRELLLDLLPILQIVHQEKIIHRDIKPENIMRRRSDGKLFLIDFGASKQLQGTAKPGTKIGSFGYASLEQMEDQKVYPASDLYSVGATCFHLLTDILPWDLWKEDGYGWVKEWQKHLPQPISSELRQILDKLLQKDYQQRYQSAEEVLQALQPPPPPVVTPIVTPPPPPPIPRPQISKSPTLPPPQNSINLIIVLTLILLSGFVVFILKSHTETNTPDISPTPTTPAIIPKNITTATLINTLTAYSKSVIAVAISPDGQTLVSGGNDNTIKIWNLATGKLKSTLTGHSDTVISLAISPDGQTLVSGSWDKTIKIWNLGTGELKSTLNGHSNVVRSLVISPDGQTLVSGSYDNTIKIWNLATGELKSTLTGHSNSVWSLAISPDGNTLVSGSSDNTIKIWNLQTGELKSTLPSERYAKTGHSDSVVSLAISPDGNTLVSGSYDKTIKIWNLATGELKSTLPSERYAKTGHSNSVWSLAISPDGNTLVSGSSDNTIKIWNLATGELKSTLTGHSSWVLSLAISPDGNTLVSGSADKTIKIWRLE